MQDSALPSKGLSPTEASVLMGMQDISSDVLAFPDDPPVLGVAESRFASGECQAAATWTIGGRALPILTSLTWNETVAEEDALRVLGGCIRLTADDFMLYRSRTGRWPDQDELSVLVWSRGVDGVWRSFEDTRMSRPMTREEWISKGVRTA